VDFLHGVKIRHHFLFYLFIYLFISHDMQWGEKKKAIGLYENGRGPLGSTKIQSPGGGAPE
jgi:hypothetical protein